MRLNNGDTIIHLESSPDNIFNRYRYVRFGKVYMGDGKTLSIWSKIMWERAISNGPQKFRVIREFKQYQNAVRER